MPARLIRFLAVAIALVLPLQGLAAVTMGQCMVLGHHQDDGHQADGHAHDEGASDHDHSSHSHADKGSHAAAGEESDGGSGHCGPCTACCASASISGPAGLFLPALASTARYAFSHFLPPSVQLDGLDRPPLAL